MNDLIWANWNVQMKTIPINLPVNNETVASGMCGTNTSQISLTFKKDWVLSLNFTRSGKSYFVDAVKLVFTADNTSFPNITKADQGLLNPVLHCYVFTHRLPKIINILSHTVFSISFLFHLCMGGFPINSLEHANASISDL